MRRSVLTIAACFSLFSLTVGCNNAEQKAEDATTNAVETTTNTADEMTSTAQQGDPKELENTDVVESGTYTGTAEIVDQEQKEVYVRLNDTTIVELYFSNDTQLVQNGNNVSFDALEEGQQLEIEVEKDGDHMKPQRVAILE